ncbi:MAG: AI-2E family transporter, partial [Bdellovibrionota bacterium]
SIVTLCVLGLALLPRISIPLTLSYVCYLMASPLVPFFTRLFRNRNFAIIFLLIVFTLVALIPFFYLLPSLRSEIERVQYYLPRLAGLIQSKFIEIKILVQNKFSITIEDIYLQDMMTKVKSFSAKLLWNLPTFLANALEWTFLVPLFLFFLMKDATSFTRLVLKITPNSIFERFYHILHELNTKIGDYIFAKFIEASIVGGIITIGLLILGVRFWALLGILAGITNIVPYIGPILGAIPALIIVYFENGMGSSFGGVLVLYLIANIIDIAIVFPVMISKIVDLHPIVVVISVIVGSQFFGFVGMIISVPIAAAIKLIALEFYKKIYSPL